MNSRLQKYFDISIALLCIVDILLRLRDFSAHYTETGVVPFAMRRLSPVIQFEFLHASATGMAILFAIAFVSAALLALGKKPLLAAFVLWLAMLSIQARNTYIGEGFDVFIRIILFWLVLFHLERLTKKPLPFSIVKIGYLLQMAQIYLCSGLYKFQSPMWQGPDALRRIFQSSVFPRGISQYLLDYPALTSLASLLIPYVLVASSLLLLVAQKHIRRASVATIIGFHLSNAIFLDVGLFSLAGIASCIALLTVQPISLAALKEYLRLSQFHPALLAITMLVSLLTFDINAKGILNLATPTFVAPLTAVEFAEKLGFRQRWSLFTDVTREGNGYFEVRRESSTASEQVFSEIPTQQPFAYREVTYPSHRWKKFLLTIEHPDQKELRQQFANYLCRRYASPGEKIVVQFHPGITTNTNGKQKKISKDWRLENNCNVT